jgi:hypothetical protein
MRLYDYHNTPSKLSGFNERMNLLPYIKNQLSMQTNALQNKLIRGPYDNDLILDLILLVENTFKTLTKLINNRHRYAETAEEVYHITRLCKSVSKELLNLIQQLLRSAAVYPAGKETLRNILDQVNQMPLSVRYEGNGEDLIWPKNSREFNLIKQDPISASRFARFVVTRHIPELEPTLLKLSPQDAVDYLEDHGHEDWAGTPPLFRGKLEDIIAQDVLASMMYVQIADVRTPFLKAERTIYFNKNPNWRGETGFPSDETAWDLYLKMLTPREAEAAQDRASKITK